MARQLLECPACGSAVIDLRKYDSMMVLRHDVALFSLECPSCGARISALQPIPPDLCDEVQCAAYAVGAGMCRV